MAISVQVELKTILSRYAPKPGEPVFDFAMPEGCTIDDLIAELSVPESWVGLIILNGERADASRSLKDDDRLVIHPLMVAGG